MSVWVTDVMVQGMWQWALEAGGNHVEAVRLEELMAKDSAPVTGEEIANDAIQTRWLLGLAMLVAFIGILNSTADERDGAVPGNRDDEMPGGAGWVYPAAGFSGELFSRGGGDDDRYFAWGGPGDGGADGELRGVRVEEYSGGGAD